MSDLAVMKEVLFHEMQVGIKTTQALLEKVRAEDWDYRPRENMRTLRELAHHLVMIPETDLAIVQEKTQEEVQAIEGRELPDAAAMNEAMEQGFLRLKDYYYSLSDQDFLEKETKAFYAPAGATQAKWCVETTTHIFHHRAQMFNYMKQLGYDINMFDLYI
ncbi:MAG TPA: DinB family protein [Bacillales bacterium]|nr:DinB family protein [Bacillales bacterium]